jgi:uncharacterized membrane protein
MKPSFLIAAALLHTAFMIFELFPWSVPVSLRMASNKLPKLANGEHFTDAQQGLVDALQSLVATVVHNAGIYNGIVAGGLFWAAFHLQSATDVARVMLIGAAVAGVFGTVTLKSLATAVQAAVGIIGLILV